MKTLTDDALALKAKTDPAARDEVLRRFRPLIQAKSSAFAGTAVPAPAMHGEGARLTLLAIDRFDPKAGATFKTYLHTTLQGLSRYNARYRNPARIPDNRVLRIQKYKDVQSMLRAQTGREPDVNELADALKWSPYEVATMQGSMYRALSSSGSTEQDFDFASRHSHKLDNRIELLYFELDPEEKLVVDFSLGMHGRPATSSVETMARQTGLTTDKIYAIKRKLAKRIQEEI